MKIGVIGGGVTGGATAAAFRGHVDEVRVYDVDPVRSNSAEANVYHFSDVVFVCLPENLVQTYFNTLPDWARSKNFVLRSTVPVGTTRYCAEKFNLPNLVHSPEFLTERTAHEDAANPRIHIVGVPNAEGTDEDGFWDTKGNRCYVVLEELLGMRWPSAHGIVMSSDCSELVKLATNGFFATKVSYWNEVESYCRAAGIEYETVRAACVAEGRVGDLHTHCPGHHGYGFSGKCLPKDLKQLMRCLTDAGVPAPVMAAVQSRNEKIDLLRNPK